MITFALHCGASFLAANEAALRHGDADKSLENYLLEPQLWFELFQNWQSEFLSTSVLVVLFDLSSAQRVTRIQARGRVQLPNRRLGLNLAITYWEPGGSGNDRGYGH